ETILQLRQREKVAERDWVEPHERRPQHVGGQDVQLVRVRLAKTLNRNQLLAIRHTTSERGARATTGTQAVNRSRCGSRRCTRERAIRARLGSSEGAPCPRNQGGGGPRAR